jgi:hypothetical protein
MMATPCEKAQAQSLEQGGIMGGVQSSVLVKRSVAFDDDVLAWLATRGEQLDRSVNWQVRAILRREMDREQRKDADASASTAA